MDPAQQFYPAVTADVRYEDKIWAVPQFFQPPAAVLLNQRVLKAEGVDPAQIDTSKPDQPLAAAKKLYTENDGKPTRLGFDPVATGAGPLW
jgi:multiple sugar transport system substrate-binding protein